jgi:hypothetical protein
MEISLPYSKVFFDSVLDGSITALRMPKANAKVGDVITAKMKVGTVKLRIKNIEYPLLYGITVEDAKQEGYAAPDFCSMNAICANMESRLDFESLAFDQSGDTPKSRSGAKFEKELYERVKTGCRSCLLKKDEKDLFLAYWSNAYQDMENKEITKITFEVITDG